MSEGGMVERVGGLEGLDEDGRAGLADDLADATQAALEQAAAAGARALQTDGPPTVADLATVRATFTRLLDERLMAMVAEGWEAGAAALRLALAELALPEPEALTAAGWVPPPPAAELAGGYLARARNRLAGISDAVWAATRQALLDGIEAGEGPRELATRVQAAAQVPLGRALTIARTEALGAASAGDLAQVRAAGLAGTKTWRCSLDARVRPTHAPDTGAHGQTVPVGDPFLVGGWPMDRPHDPAGPPEETINCRCHLTYDLQLGGGGGLAAAGTPAQLARQRERDRALLARLREPRGVASTAAAVTAAAPPTEGEEAEGMPWRVQDDHPDCSGYAVVNTETDELAEGGCHETRAEAEDHARALYANTTEEERASLEHPALATVDPAAGRYAFTLAFEDQPTLEAPAREFKGGVLTWDATPFPLKWQEREDDGHKGSVVAGRVDAVWREPDRQRLRGVLQFDLQGTHGAEAHRLIQGRYLKGGSLLADDITDEDVEYVLPAPDPAQAAGEEPSGGGGLLELFGPAPEKVVFHAGRIRSWTLVAEPAFAEALVEVPDTQGMVALAAQGVALAGVDNSTWDANAAMTACTTAACYRSICAGRKAGPPDQRSSYALPHHKTQGGPPNADGVRNALSRLPQTQGLTNKEEAQRHLEAHMSSIRASALVAAAAHIEIPDVPPVWWFDEPFETSRIGGLTVTPEGRVYGLLAPFGVAHRGFDQVIEAPRGTVDYSDWQNKPAFAELDGEVIQVAAGNITMGCGHAPRLRRNERVGPEHYDNSCSVAARVRIGENAHGVWVAGALLPDVDAAQVQRMLACELSGDWEPHRTLPGWQRFVAAHLVPVGGFPTAQEDPGVRVRFRDGRLVASAVPVRLGEDPPAPDELATRRRRLADRIAASVGRDPASRRAALTARVHPASRTEGVTP